MSSNIGGIALRTPLIVLPAIEIDDYGGGGKKSNYPALIDTGATRTIVPEGVMDDVGLVPYDRRKLKLANGSLIECFVLKARIEIPSIGYRDMEVFAMNRKYILIGMDVISSYYLKVDGKTSRWTMSSSPI